MQPPEPPAAAGPVPPGAAGRKPRNRRLRLILALAGGVLVLLCLGGVGVVVSLYDEATEIKRSSPDVVADSFLIAYVQNRDDKQAELFLCTSPNLSAIKGLRDEIDERETKPGNRVSVRWGVLQRQTVGGGQEDVTTELTISGGRNGQMISSRNEQWRFRLVEADGWRVCNATKVTPPTEGEPGPQGSSEGVRSSPSDTSPTPR